MSNFMRNNLFGGSATAGREPSPQPPPRGTPHSAMPDSRGAPTHRQQQPSSYDQPMQGGYDNYNTPPPSYNVPPQSRGMAPPQQPPRHSGRSANLLLQPTNSPDNTYTYRNLVAVSTQDVPSSPNGQDIYLLVNGQFVVTARPLDRFEPGKIGLSSPQRTWMGIALTDQVQIEPYDIFSKGKQAYLGSIDVEIGFATTKRTRDAPYDQDALAKYVTDLFRDQVFAPGQRFIMDLESIPFLLLVKTVQVMDLSGKPGSGTSTSDPRERGMMTPDTQINFFKDPKTPMNLKASSRRPAANAIITPDFKFEDMGIGGLDAEFSTIFRRAFASRIFPPGLVEKLGIQHVKGILLFGPPGTGKTLIARQIGKMLNAREPKIINGPEVLNKFVGQSEENIRKMFADAEKEYKEKGDESGLHIIIFDELDAVCKQRGSGAGGGTGVGDSIVNQLLSKLDGVDQLNNILLIGMTNRKDMIDDALLRPGRLEVHMEISLPDEHGRSQILKIHTQKMRDNKIMDSDVDVLELARQTKNFSGAEIAGLVKSATSFAFNRHVKVGTMAGVSDDVVNMKVNASDFQNALDEVKPAFGVSEEDLANCLDHGVIKYSTDVQDVLDSGKLFTEQVRDPKLRNSFSVVMHGLSGCGKTALAAQIAINSGFFYVKRISADDMVGFSESMKIGHISKIFMDAYKSPLSVLVLDSIERLIEWVPVGPRFSNPILQTLRTVLNKAPPPNRKLLILATTSRAAVLEQLDLWDDFNASIKVPVVKTYQELEIVMKESKMFTSDLAIRQAIADVQDTTRSQIVNVGIKKILSIIDTASKDTQIESAFAERMSSAMAASSADR